MCTAAFQLRDMHVVAGPSPAMCPTQSCAATEYAELDNKQASQECRFVQVVKNGGISQLLNMPKHQMQAQVLPGSPNKKILMV